MGLNQGYLKSDISAAGDEVFTPEYAIAPLLEFLALPPLNIWAPFDQEDSNYVKVLREAGYDVIHSHIADGQDFFEYEPEEYDMIISNPPFSKKDAVLRRLVELGKPFAVLLPLPVLQGQKRFEDICQCEVLVFDKRIAYFKDKETCEIQKGTSFASIYVCRHILPEKLVFRKLKED